jgi:NitT/TauT family transport system substrate-binding protein
MRGRGSCGVLWSGVVLLALAAGGCAGGHAEAPATAAARLVVGVGPDAGNLAAVWTATDLGLFAERALDVEFKAFASTPVCISAMVSGQLALCVNLGGVVIVNAALAGADVKAIGALINTVPYSLIAAPDVRSVRNLAGRRVAVNRPGTPPDHALRLGLATAGLSLQDVEAVSIGDQAQRLAALQTRRVDATLISPPGALNVQREGFQVLLDLSRLHIPYPHGLIAAGSDTLAGRPDAVLRFLDAVAEGTRRFKADRNLGLEVLGRRYGAGNPEDLIETYDMFTPALADPPAVSDEAMHTLLSLMAETDAAVAGASADRFVDHWFMREVESRRARSTSARPVGPERASAHAE